MPEATLLLVDDSPEIRLVYPRILQRQGYTVLTAETAERGLALFDDHRIDVALVDLVLPRMSGEELIAEIRERSPTTEMVAITAYTEAQAAFGALRAGARDYFSKPIEDWDRVFAVIRRCLQLGRVRRRVATVAPEVNERVRDVLVGNSPAMERLRETIALVAPHPVAVLVRGESGAGKERVAQAIHAAGPRPDANYVGINCAGIPATLLESELFGYERGSHSQAVETREGLFEFAADGTVLLDEIGDMPMEMQAKLLRVLQEGVFRRVGGQEVIPLRARVLSATHVDLRKAVERGDFREDLYYRLNTFEIEVPPLNQRREDVPLLAWYFVTRLNERLGKHITRIAPDAMAMLKAHDWSANHVRELERTMSRAMIYAVEREEIGPDEVLLALGVSRPPIAEEAGDEDAARERYPVDLYGLHYRDAKDWALEDFSRWYLRGRLRETAGNIARASELAGMARPNFSRLMKRHGVTIDDLDD